MRCLKPFHQLIQTLLYAAVGLDPSRLIPGYVGAPVFVLEAELCRELIHCESEGLSAVADFLFGHDPRTLADYVAWRNTFVRRWQCAPQGREAHALLRTSGVEDRGAIRQGLQRNLRIFSRSRAAG